MKTEDQIKALAELDGIEFQAIDGITRWRYATGSWNIFQLPNYLESYSEAIPLIQKQPYGIRREVWRLLHTEVTGDTGTTDGFLVGAGILDLMFAATPAQLSEALLRATGKWKD